MNKYVGTVPSTFQLLWAFNPLDIYSIYLRPKVFGHCLRSKVTKTSHLLTINLVLWDLWSAFWSLWKTCTSKIVFGCGIAPGFVCFFGFLFNKYLHSIAIWFSSHIPLPNKKSNCQLRQFHPYHIDHPSLSKNPWIYTPGPFRMRSPIAFWVA